MSIYISNKLLSVMYCILVVTVLGETKVKRWICDETGNVTQVQGTAAGSSFG